MADVTDSYECTTEFRAPSTKVRRVAGPHRRLRITSERHALFGELPSVGSPPSFMQKTGVHLAALIDTERYMLARSCSAEELQLRLQLKIISASASRKIIRATKSNSRGARN